MLRHGGRNAGFALLLSTYACVDRFPSEPSACRTPLIAQVAVSPGDTNVLSARVTARIARADSAKVLFRAPTSIEASTPLLEARGDSIVAFVLGLRASTTYDAQLVVANRCGETRSERVSFTTKSLPEDLPSFNVEGSAPSPGFVVMSVGKFGLVIDNTGRVVWYRRFPNGPGLNFQAQPNGHFVARPPAANGATPEFLEVAPDGSIGRTLGCARGLQPRLHDMIAEPNGAYWLMCDETRIVDLSSQGASSRTAVVGTVVQHRSANGDVLFEWSAFDHLVIELNVLDAVDRNAASVNWTHGNALDLDADGSLILSLRNLNEVIKIDSRTGAVIWRLGGTHSQLLFADANALPFVHQHGVRALGTGALMILNNLGNAAGSRAERYVIDEATMTARMNASFGETARLIALVGGTTQSLTAGHTLVSFGSGAGVEEYDATGNTVWRLTGNLGYIFRAQRIQSLYQPGVGDPR